VFLTVELQSIVLSSIDLSSIFAPKSLHNPIKENNQKTTTFVQSNFHDFGPDLGPYLGAMLAHLGVMLAVLAPLGAPLGDLGRHLILAPRCSPSAKWSLPDFHRPFQDCSSSA